MRGFIKEVLNLVINGLPSIPNVLIKHSPFQSGFKPCYKWITFNTKDVVVKMINSLVLNLVINGLPSILVSAWSSLVFPLRFKPCYKWITFNTIKSFNFF